MSRVAFSISSLSSALLLAVLLTGCGFQPLYSQQKTGSDNALLAGVKIDPIDGRLGQQFRIRLEDQLNPSGVVPANARYRLNVTLVTSEAGIGVARDGTVSRYNVYLDSNYTLYRLSDGQKMTTGSLRQVSSYNNITNQYYSTYVAQEDAFKRGVDALAQVYRQRLATYLSENDGNPQAKTITEPPLKLPVPLSTTGQNSPNQAPKAY